MCVKELDRRLQHIVQHPSKYQSQRFVSAIILAVLEEKEILHSYSVFQWQMIDPALHTVLEWLPAFKL